MFLFFPLSFSSERCDQIMDLGSKCLGHKWEEKKRNKRRIAREEAKIVLPTFDTDEDEEEEGSKE